MILQHIMKHLPISLLIALKLVKKTAAPSPQETNGERDTVFLRGGGRL